jgi:hypothetical protein
MLESERKHKEDRLSVRTSIIVWLGGAVLGWVVAVLAIYTVLRAPDKDVTGLNASKGSIQQATGSPTDGGNPANLSAIEPAAGPGTAAKPADQHKNTTKMTKP